MWVSSLSGSPAVVFGLPVITDSPVWLVMRHDLSSIWPFAAIPPPSQHTECGMLGTSVLVPSPTHLSGPGQRLSGWSFWGQHCWQSHWRWLSIHIVNIRVTSFWYMWFLETIILRVFQPLLLWALLEVWLLHSQPLSSGPLLRASPSILWPPLWKGTSPLSLLYCWQMHRLPHFKWSVVAAEQGPGTPTVWWWWHRESQSAGNGMTQPVSGSCSSPRAPPISPHITLLQGHCVEHVFQI